MTESEIILLIVTGYCFLTINTVFTILSFYKLRDILEEIKKK